MAEVPYVPVPTENLSGPATARQNIQASPEAFGAGVGRQMQNLGQTIAGALDPWAQQEAQAKNFDKETIWQKTQNQIETEGRNRAQNMQGDGVGFTDGMTKYSQEALVANFKAGGYSEVPAEYQPKYQAALGGWTRQFAGMELQKRVVNQKNTIEGSLNEQLMTVVQDPTTNTLEVFQKKTFDLIDKSNLPPIEKEAMKQKATADYKYFYGVGKSNTDPQYVLAATGQTKGGLANAIGQKESNNRALGVHGPGTTAAGRYGFTEGTWISTANSPRGKAAGLDPAGSARLNDEQQQKGIQVLIANNADDLKNNGVPVNDANLYLAHFMGSGGAIAMLKADRGASAAQLFPKEAAANPSIFYRKGKPGEDGVTGERVSRTVGEVISLQTNGLGGSVHDPYISQLPPQQQLQLAGQSERTIVSEENARATADRASIARNMDILLANVSEGKAGHAEIGQAFQSGYLSGEQYVSYNKMADEFMKTKNLGVEAGRKIAAQEPFDPYDKDSAKGIDSLSDQHRKTAGVTEAQAQAFDNSLYASSGIMPSSAQVGLRSMIFGGNPSNVALGMQQAANYLAIARARGFADPFAGVEGKEAMTDAAVFFRHGTVDMGKSAQDVTNEWMEKRSPDYQLRAANTKVLTEQYQKDILTKDPTPDILKAVAPVGWFQFSNTVGETQKNEMVGTYNELRTEYYSKYHDAGAADAYAKEKMSHMYGEVDGKIMKWPINKNYPALPDGTHQYVYSQAKETIKGYTGHDAEDVYFLPVTQFATTTRGEYTAGRPAPYQLFYTHKDANGQVVHDMLLKPDGTEAGWRPDFDRALSDWRGQQAAKAAAVAAQPTSPAEVRMEDVPAHVQTRAGSIQRSPEQRTAIAGQRQAEQQKVLKETDAAAVGTKPKDFGSYTEEEYDQIRKLQPTTTGPRVFRGMRVPQ